MLKPKPSEKARRIAETWKKLEKELEGIPISTTNEIPGYELTDYMGYVWGTTVQSKFIGHDILAAIRTFVGGEIMPYTRMVNEAKQRVIHQIVQNAKFLGADAVIGVRMGSAQVIPGTIEIYAYGTAFKIRKKK